VFEPTAPVDLRRLFDEPFRKRVWDNAATESFFSSLKIEWIGRTVYRTRDAARATADADLTG
jgi:hypothetical protein